MELIIDLIVLAFPAGFVAAMILIKMYCNGIKEATGSSNQAWALGYWMGSPQLQRRYYNHQVMSTLGLYSRGGRK